VTRDAVVFDMDGVLIDTGAHHRAAWRALLDEVGIQPAEDFWRLTIGRPAEEAVPLLLGVELPPEEASRLAARKREHYAAFAKRGVQAVAGVGEFVDTLAEAGVPCAVATSATRQDVERLLLTLGFSRRFRAIVTSEDVRLGKPDPEVYRRAAEALAIGPTRCLAFEDSVAGVHAARGAGMAVIGVTTAYTDRELTAAGAIRTIPTFEGLGWPL
jgi:HAD superfamily hydrolase (TIGR01509 family)